MKCCYSVPRMGRGAAEAKLLVAQPHLSLLFNQWDFERLMISPGLISIFGIIPWWFKGALMRVWISPEFHHEHSCTHNLNMDGSCSDGSDTNRKTRRSHKKSRNGCEKCKVRRIKVCWESPIVWVSVLTRGSVTSWSPNAQDAPNWASHADIPQETEYQRQVKNMSKLNHLCNSKDLKEPSWQPSLGRNCSICSHTTRQSFQYGNHIQYRCWHLQNLYYWNTILNTRAKTWLSMMATSTPFKSEFRTWLSKASPSWDQCLLSRQFANATIS